MRPAKTDPWLWDCDCVITSDPAAARRLLDEMLAQLEAQHWQQREIFAVHLATEEALVNAIRHGNGLDARKTVRFVCLLGATVFTSKSPTKGRGLIPRPCRIRPATITFTPRAAEA